MRRRSAINFVNTRFVHAIGATFYKMSLRYSRMKPTSGKVIKSLADAFSGSPDFVEALKLRLRSRFFVSDLNNKEFYIGMMTSLVEDASHKTGFDAIMDDADMVHENKFSAYGSAAISLGQKIDWHTDYKSGKRWPVSFYTKINQFKSDDQSDIKIPWSQQASPGNLARQSILDQS